MLHHSWVQLHHSSATVCTIHWLQYCTIHQYSCTIHQYSCTIRQLLFCTIRRLSSAPFVNLVLHPSLVTVLHHSSATLLHHSLATILRHLFMLFYNSASTNNLATDANTLSRQFNCISEILVLATAACRIFALSVGAFILLSRLSFTILASSRCSAARQLDY